MHDHRSHPYSLFVRTIECRSPPASTFVLARSAATTAAATSIDVLPVLVTRGNDDNDDNDNGRFVLSTVAGDMPAPAQLLMTTWSIWTS